MKKILAILLSAVMLLALAACGENKSGLIKGVVVSAADGALKVNSENTELTFTTENVADMPALAAGDKILLTYTGEIKDADTSKAVLTEVDALAAPQSEAQPQQDSDAPSFTDALAAGRAGTFYGMVKNASMNTFTVENGNGEAAEFNINDNTVFSTADGFVDGIMVTVTFIGDYKTPADCIVVSVAQDANNRTPQQSEDSEQDSESDAGSQDENAGELSSISGTVFDMAMNTLVLETADGRQLVFVLGSAGESAAGNIGPGKQVTIVYSGEISGTDTTNCKVISVTA